MALNEPQSRSLAATLQILEERCQQMRRLLNASPESGMLYQIVQDIPAPLRESLLADVAAIEAAIAHLTADYHLTVPTHSARQMLVALLSSSAEHLVDTRPSKLQRYGSVDPELIAPLDEQLSRLLALIDTMRGAASARREEEH